MSFQVKQGWSKIMWISVFLFFKQPLTKVSVSVLVLIFPTNKITLTGFHTMYTILRFQEEKGTLKS